MNKQSQICGWELEKRISFDEEITEIQPVLRDLPKIHCSSMHSQSWKNPKKPRLEANKKSVHKQSISQGNTLIEPDRRKKYESMHVKVIYKLSNIQPIQFYKDNDSKVEESRDKPNIIHPHTIYHKVRSSKWKPSILNIKSLEIEREKQKENSNNSNSSISILNLFQKLCFETTPVPVVRFPAYMRSLQTQLLKKSTQSSLSQIQPIHETEIKMEQNSRKQVLLKKTSLHFKYSQKKSGSYLKQFKGNCQEKEGKRLRKYEIRKKSII